MSVIAIVGTKGGSGRSTITCALAIEAAKTFNKPAIYDADPQGTSFGFMRARGKKRLVVPELFKGAVSVEDGVESLRYTGSDVIFIDGLPGSLTITKEILATADIAVIPIRPGPIDVMGNEAAIKAAQEMGKPLLCVINQGRADSSKNVEFAREWLAKRNVKVAKTMIHFRDIYGMAMATGHIAPEKDPAAAAEIANLWAEIRDELGMKTKGAKAGKAAKDGRRPTP